MLFSINQPMSVIEISISQWWVSVSCLQVIVHLIDPAWFVFGNTLPCI